MNFENKFSHQRCSFLSKFFFYLTLLFLSCSIFSDNQFYSEIGITQNSCKTHNQCLKFYADKENIKDNFNDECILCTKSKDYAATIAFTKHWKITYWRNQAYLGRSLIIPKRHFGTYEEMTDEEAKEYREILKKFLPALQKTFKCTHFNVAYLMNQAYRIDRADPPRKHGKPNPHFHWHIIPRYEQKCAFGDEIFEDPYFGNSFDFNRKQYLTGEFQEKAIEAIRANLNIIYLSEDTSN